MYPSISLTAFYLKVDSRSKLKQGIHIHLYFIATEYLWILCPCGRYRQPNSVLYPNNHILKSSTIIFNGLVLKDLYYLPAIWKQVNQGCVVFSSKLNTNSSSEAFIMYICMLIPQNICLWNLLIGNERATLNIKLSSAAICNTDSHRSHTSCVVLVMLLCVKREW